jgi:D-glycero-alpha-D-manno-heptose 1-phosphate guanylyltransferase
LAQVVREAVILAGGIGSRLKSAVKHVPKPMAEVSGRPFLEYLLDYIHSQKIKRIILAVGYKHEIIMQHFGTNYKGLELIYSVELEPLGTGGAIKNALGSIEGSDFFILNGDTYFTVSLSRLYEFHKFKGAVLTMALRPLNNFSRYGTVKLNDSGRIVGFKEKGYRKQGMINGGIYLIRRGIIKKAGLPAKFSFEKEFLEKYVQTFAIYGLPFKDCFFIDIGIPEDYARAQDELTGEANRLSEQAFSE